MNPCILSYTCLSWEWEASSFLLLSLKGGFVFVFFFFWLAFFFKTQMFNVKNEVCSVKDVWVDLRRQMKAMTPAGNPPSPCQMDRSHEAQGDCGEKERGLHFGPPWAVLLSPVHWVHSQLLIGSVSQWFPLYPFPMSSPGPPEAVFLSWSYKGICCHMILFAVRLKQKGSAHRKSHYQWRV